MTDLWNSAVGLVDAEMVASWVRAAILVLVGFVLARIVAGAIDRFLTPRVDRQRAALARRAFFHTCWSIFAIAAMHQLGFDLGVLLGAAGILTVALGFASQTSASNLVSGLFLLAEQPFQLGDVITVGGTTGEVLSIDLLSVKLRTYDNLFVRIPNETLIKSEVRTLTRFPVRRADCLISVAYREDLSRVHEVLLAVADRNPLALDEPEPLFVLRGFGESGIDIQFSVWARRENFLAMRNSVQFEIKTAFDEEGIEIPFPHRSLYAGSGTEPLPIRVVADDGPRLESS